MAIHDSTRAGGPPRRPRGVVPVGKTVVAALLLVALILIGQHFSLGLYAVGIVMILAVVLIGFTVNNVADRTSVPRLLLLVLLTWAIVAVIFAVGYFLAPVLAGIGG